MDHLRRPPAKTKDELRIVPVNERAAEVRAIKAGCTGGEAEAT